MHSSRIGIFFSDFKGKRRARDMDAVEFNVNVVNAVIARQETYRVDVSVDGRDEAIVFASGWGNHLMAI